MQCVCIFFHVMIKYPKFEFLISQGSVATCLRWSGWCHMGFVANFIRFPTVQKFWRSVNIWQSYREFNGGNFFETQCRYWEKLTQSAYHVARKPWPWICQWHSSESSVHFTLGMGGTQNFVHGIYREKNTAVPVIPHYLFRDSSN